MRPSLRTIAPALACLAAFQACRATVEEPALPPAWTAADAARPLSRRDCIDLAMRSAPTAAAWKARLLAARADLEQAQKLPNPALSLGWEDFGLTPKSAGTPVQTTLTLAMSLEDLFARKRRAAAASCELEAEEADLRAEQLSLSADVARAYDELVAARTKLELHLELQGVAETHRAAVAEFVAAGLSARIESERADAELAASRAEMAKAEADERMLEIGFEFSLGFDRPVPLQLAEGLTASTRTAPRDLDGRLALAAGSRPEIAAAEARYRAGLERMKLSAERTQFLPTLSAGPRNLDGELTGVASVDLVLPVFDTGSAAERSHEAALLGLAAELRRVAQRTAADVCRASERLSAAESYLEEHARDLAERRRTLRASTERLFQAGQAEYDDLVLARRDEVEARIGLLDAELATATARIELDAAVGAPPDE